MTMTTTIETEKPLTPAQAENRRSAELIPVGKTGTEPQNFAQAVDYAKFMAQARSAVPHHLVSNVGACMAVMEIANKFGFPAYMVARQTYLVNNQMAFMGQFVMAVINRFCPLKERLKYRFEGEGPTLRIIVSGHISGEVDPVEYKSPMIKDIKTKNSPLWIEDPEQQLVYYGSRRWQSRYWPEGLFGIYSPDAGDETPPGAENARDITPGSELKERLAAGAGPTGEGFGNGAHVAGELDNIAGNQPQSEPEKTAQPTAGAPNEHPGTSEQPKAETAQPEASTPAGPDKAPTKPKRGRPAKPKTDEPQQEKPATETAHDAPAEPPQTPPPAEPPPPVQTAQTTLTVLKPRTPEQYSTWARLWIADATSVAAIDDRWKAERGLRGDCMVVEDVFEILKSVKDAKVNELKAKTG